jgi:hypothetical protein
MTLTPRWIDLLAYVNESDTIDMSFNDSQVKVPLKNGAIGSSLSNQITLEPSTILDDSFLEVVNNISSEENINSIHFRLKPSIEYSIEDSKTIKLLLSKGYTVQLSFITLIKLGITEPELWQQIRKSNKNNINKEKKRLEKKLFESQGDDISIFEDWKRLYLKAISRGGKTLDDVGFDIMREAILGSKSFLMVAYEDGVAMGGVVFSFNEGYATYGLAANDTSIEGRRFIGHYLVIQSLNKLNKESCDTVELGPLVFENQLFCSVDGKTLSISEFKQGFGGLVVPVYNFSKFFNEDHKHEYFSKLTNNFDIKI